MAGDLVIVAASRRIDGHGSLVELAEIRDRFEANGARVHEHRIAPLRFGWNAPLPDGYLKGACAPIEALISARAAIAARQADAALISGIDPIKTEFAGRREDRERLMRIYGQRSFLEAYDELAGAMRARLSMSMAEFEELAEHLFENYWATSALLDPSRPRPGEQWFKKVTPHFRGVDCANPNIDFEGAILVTSARHAQAAGCDPDGFVRVDGLSVTQRGNDGIAHIPEIASYEHLAAAYDEACAEAGADIGGMLHSGRARLEIYSCFPVVPLAFLLATGVVSGLDEIPSFLKRHPATITGGLNLARAPWNNTTLNAIIQATQMICAGTELVGIHSNSALGYKQGFVVLRPAPLAWTPPTLSPEAA